MVRLVNTGGQQCHTQIFSFRQRLFMFIFIYNLLCVFPNEYLSFIVTLNMHTFTTNSMLALYVSKYLHVYYLFYFNVFRWKLHSKTMYVRILNVRANKMRFIICQKLCEFIPVSACAENVAIFNMFRHMTKIIMIDSHEKFSPSRRNWYVSVVIVVNGKRVEVCVICSPGIIIHFQRKNLIEKSLVYLISRSHCAKLFLHLIR